MTRTERFDFFILFFVFGVLVAGTSSFSVFIAQIFVRFFTLTPYPLTCAIRLMFFFKIKGPHGYSDVTAGLIGGIFLLSGLVAALIAAPLFDRVLIHHLAKTVKLALPILSVAWVCLIFVGEFQIIIFPSSIAVECGILFFNDPQSHKVKPNNLAGIYVVLISISSVSFILLPVGLELGVEITHSAETSTAILWSGGNTVSVLWVLGANLLFYFIFLLACGLLLFSFFPAMNALRDGPDGNPPLNMKRALIFNAAFITATSLLTIPFTGAQTRRKIDEQKAKDVSAAIQMENVQT